MKIIKEIFILMTVILCVSSSSFAQNYSCPIKIAVTNQTNSSISSVKIKNLIAGITMTTSIPDLNTGSSLVLPFQNSVEAVGKFKVFSAGRTLCYGNYNLHFIPDLINPCKLNMNYASYTVINNPEQTSQQGIQCSQTGILNAFTQTSLTVGIEKTN